LSAIVSGLGALCTLLVLYRVLISHPFSHAQVKFGAWLGLISCALIAYGGYRAMSEEGAMLADVREQAQAT
jgi:formate hydrogenlyase subunit 3/multisubunit Na+/H+ antiporter MnhD subunit